MMKSIVASGFARVISTMVQRVHYAEPVLYAGKSSANRLNFVFAAVSKYVAKSARFAFGTTGSPGWKFLSRTWKIEAASAPILSVAGSYKFGLGGSDLQVRPSGLGSSGR
jgi:hypothetical protein